MDCKRHKAVKIDDRSVKEQEYRKVSRIWEKVVKKPSTTAADAEVEEPKKCMHHRSNCFIGKDEDSEIQEPSSELSPAALQRKMAKMKSFGKRKSPLQKFDEIVTRELMSRKVEDDESICTFEGVQKWQTNLEYSNSSVMPSNRKLMNFDTSMSKTALQNAEKELKDTSKDPSELENCALMDAIERLVQAQASCRFDAAVKAAEAAASSVPIELAEEVAITCAKDYQSQIIDIVNEKVAGRDGNKPMEIIGYIGITKKSNDDDDDY
ncbi:UNVERIFIED_CONTAM: hypothetical protein PYX00_007205 [Menopon gallinae]|uniref:Uncharacterized protein n=1 Tax=Menopon gallinae TaxID=328185 RepID=A0AAW2HIL4_9NEOP